ncbi:MAG: DUF418 domain-containing protein [Chitinophagaceae bacterium]|nr:MAG: DUF418 domain-containing protein [Chitinophagaceae bacterium]
MPAYPSPVHSFERSPILDVLRGLALPGIFLNNIYAFSGYGYLEETQQQKFATYPVDRIADYLQIIFVEGKFYSLFSFLFGIGFSILLRRGQQKGHNTTALFYRRLLVLLLIGAAHLLLLWEGDILLLYALLGALLPLFRNVSDKTLLIWAAALILSPVVIDLVKLWLQVSPAQFLQPIGVAIDAQNGITEQNWRSFLYTENSGWKEWRAWQESGWAIRFHYLLDSNRLPKVLGVFLLGFYAGRKMIYARLADHKPLLKKTMLWGYGVGLPFSIAMAYFEHDERVVFTSAWGMADTVSYALSVVPLALAYAATIGFFSLRYQQPLNFFAPAGRMALTTYLSQTLIGILLFYNLGLGLGQQFGLLYLFCLVIAIYTLQAHFSRWWLRRFNYGPVEWIWRQLTYGKRLPLQRQKKVAAQEPTLSMLTPPTKEPLP